MIILWILVFIFSLAALVKGADWLLEGAEKIGLSLGFTPFIIGVVIVGAGTSFPELISSLSAIFNGAPEMVVANAVGSNIANILLVVGLAAVIGRKLVVSKDLIDLDLPLLSIGTVLLLGVVWDRQVNFPEAILLILAYIIYLIYTITYKDDDDDVKSMEVLPSRKERRKHIVTSLQQKIKRPKIQRKDIILLLIGSLGLVLGAKYLIDSVINLSEIFNIGAGVIAISAVAFGTSLPELIVSAKAAYNKKSEMALGNIFGSNVFNALVVVGIPGLITTLPVDNITFTIGVPTMAFATLLFVISGISRKIYIWEGALYLLLYVLFIAKLFNLF